MVNAETVRAEIVLSFQNLVGLVTLMIDIAEKPLQFRLCFHGVNSFLLFLAHYILLQYFTAIGSVFVLFHIFTIKKPSFSSDIKRSREAENRAEGSVLLLAFFKFFEKMQKTFENPLG